MSTCQYVKFPTYIYVLHSRYIPTNPWLSHDCSSVRPAALDDKRCPLVRARTGCAKTEADRPLLSFQVLLRACLDQIEQMLREFTEEHASSIPGRDAPGATSRERNVNYSKAETPTDVREVHFWRQVWGCGWGVWWSCRYCPLREAN